MFSISNIQHGLYFTVLSMRKYDMMQCKPFTEMKPFKLTTKMRFPSFEKMKSGNHESFLFSATCPRKNWRMLDSFLERLDNLHPVATAFLTFSCTQ